MSVSFASIVESAQQLSLAERKELVEILRTQLQEDAENESETFRLSEAWMEEIKRRSAEYDAGLTESHSLEDVLKEFRMIQE